MSARFLLFLLAWVPISLHSQYYFGVYDDVKGEWNVGIQLGLPQVRGDVAARIPSYEGGIYLQRSLSRIFDIRLQLQSGLTYGLDLKPSHNFASNPSYNGYFNPEAVYDTLSSVYYNFRMRYHHATLNVKLNLNRLFTRKGQQWDLYVMGGIGALGYHTRVDALTETRQPYDFDRVRTDDDKRIKSDLVQLLDGHYETQGDYDPINTRFIGKYALKQILSGGAGFKFNLGMRWGLGVEGRYQWVADDRLDGQQWTTHYQASDSRDALWNVSLLFEYAFW